MQPVSVFTLDWICGLNTLLLDTMFIVLITSRLENSLEEAPPHPQVQHCTVITPDPSNETSFLFTFAVNSIKPHHYPECSSLWNTWELWTTWTLRDDSKSARNGRASAVGTRWTPPELTHSCTDVWGGDAAPEKHSRWTEAAGCLYFCCYSLNSLFMTHKDRRPRSYRSLFNTYSRPTCDWNEQQWGRGL